MSQESSESIEVGMTEQPKRYRVVKDYQTSNSYPFSILVGETFQISEKSDAWDGNTHWIWVWCTDSQGKSGWVPKSAIIFHSDDRMGSARYTYTARELTVTVGDELLGYQQESGWLWGVNQQGENGWIPLNHLTLLS